MALKSVRERYPVLWAWAYPYRRERCERCGAEGAAPVRLFNTHALALDLCAQCAWSLHYRRWDALPASTKALTWDRLMDAWGAE